MSLVQLSAELWANGLRCGSICDLWLLSVEWKLVFPSDRSFVSITCIIVGWTWFEKSSWLGRCVCHLIHLILGELQRINLVCARSSKSLLLPLFPLDRLIDNLRVRQARVRVNRRLFRMNWLGAVFTKCLRHGTRTGSDKFRIHLTRLWWNGALI